MKYNNKRRSLYRRSLFSSDVEDTLETMTVVCQDCGYVTEIAGSPTSAICPKCGGTRFSPKWSVFSPDNVPEPIPDEGEGEKSFSSKVSLFGEKSYSDVDRFFSNQDNRFEYGLKIYSDTNLENAECISYIGTTKDHLVEKGFAEYNEDNGTVSISEDAYEKAKMFSKIVITVTKVLDLDPKITADMEIDKSNVINSLERSGNLCPKGIILIKKAHGILPTLPHEEECCCGLKDASDWLEDSGILGDLKLEFGGLTQPSSDFSSMLNRRYPDAPPNILDILKSCGVIRIGDGNISILR